MNEELDRVKALQIPAILIFGIPEHKDEVGSGAYDEHGIVQTAIRRIKKDYPDLRMISIYAIAGLAIIRSAPSAISSSTSRVASRPFAGSI